ncbi:DUF6415 family natural product biosynthesis protein [Streptomyces sp. NPDC046275]|uniref:DUF6415 family natural product biosynthesis protein n=1 Tax=Streptomyces sp. NPDC046275 TaxID=3157201 RepID=UPI0033E59897
MTHAIVLHDPTGTRTADIPLDRKRLERLAAEVLAWRQGGMAAPSPADADTAALQLAGYAQLLIAEVRAALQHLSVNDPARARTEITCGEALRRLSPPAFRRRGGDLIRAQKRARIVQALHKALDEHTLLDQAELARAAADAWEAEGDLRRPS